MSLKKPSISQAVSVCFDDFDGKEQLLMPSRAK
jgi:hypothetical protein